MMEKLAPPTDNLYKFIAIAGLIGTILGIVLAARQVNTVMQSHVVAIESLQEAWLAVGDSEEARTLLNDSIGKARRGESTFGLSIAANDIEGLNADAMTAIRDFEIQSDTYAREVQIKRGWDWPHGSLIGLSLVVMGLGFVLWYRRTQRLLDIVLRHNAEEEAPSEVQTGPANANRKWTAEEEEQLEEGFSNKLTLKELAQNHERTRNAIRYRLLKLGLIEEPAPSGSDDDSVKKIAGTAKD